MGHFGNLLALPYAVRKCEEVNTQEGSLWPVGNNKFSSLPERQIPYHITYLRNLKYDTNELVYERERDSQTENRLVVAKGEGEGWRDWKFGVSRCKLLSREWINNKVLLYSTENYIQYPGINHNGK